MKAGTKVYPVKKQTPEQRAVILRALAIKKELGCATDAEFVAGYLPGISAPMWSRLVADNWTGAIDRNIAKVAQAVQRMEVILARNASEGALWQGLGEEFYMLPLFAGIQGAVETAMAERGQDRLVLCALKTGGGKSAMCRYLQQKFGAKVLHARGSYRHSSMPFLLDLCTSLGIPAPASKHKAETAVLAALNKGGRGLLCIDEGNVFGGDAITFLKTILNCSTWSIAFFATPTHLQEMMTYYWKHSDQLLRRAVAIIRQPPMEAADVRPFLEPVIGNDPGLRDACERIAGAANLFGQFAMVTRVCKRMKSAADAQGAIQTVQRLLQTDTLPKDGQKPATKNALKRMGN